MRWPFGGNKDGKLDPDMSGTKVYDVNGLKKGTRGQLQDQIGEIAQGYLDMNDPLGGAQRLLDMFTLVPNRTLMETSAEIRYVALGSAETKGPIQHLLEEAANQVIAKGSTDLATRTKYEQLHGRYLRMVKDITGVEPTSQQPQAQEPADTRDFPRLYRPPADHGPGGGGH